MSRVVVTPTVAAEPVIYEGASGVNYDSDGFAVVVTGQEPEPSLVAVWAPGQWQHADLETDAQ